MNIELKELNIETEKILIEFYTKQRRVIAVKRILHQPYLPDDMRRYWNRVLMHLTGTIGIKSLRSNVADHDKEN
jgi:hypothetical protein